MDYLHNRSLDENFPVEIIYEGKNNQFTKRTILVKSINESFIKAYCYKRKQSRIFKLDSIFAVYPVKEKRENERLMNDKGFAPSVREIRDAVHLASSSTVYTHMEKLKEKGYITWEPSQPRTLRILKNAS